MTAVLPDSYITTPATTPLRGTLLDTATVLDDVGWMDTTGLSNSYNCLTTNSFAVWPCDEVTGPDKEFEAPAWQDGFRFVTYAGVNCRTVGFDREEALREAVRVFEAKESVGVEQAFMEQRFVESVDHWPAPVDITPASGAVKPAVGIAMIEQHAGVNYAGAATVHASRLIGSMLWKEVPLSDKGGTFVTPQGTKVASGAGYGIANQSPAGVAAAAGESWMYATGEVSIARGKIVSRLVVSHEDNEVFALVERPYIAVVDCYAAAIRVKVE